MPDGMVEMLMTGFSSSLGTIQAATPAQISWHANNDRKREPDFWPTLPGMEDESSSPGPFVEASREWELLSLSPLPTSRNSQTKRET
ncbi:hypothetical protein SCP_0402590 [Sparassis crispa]|uniref:Uncharacterized protein n=1 Tax=Sparassis crispa TaxID=139825 RepID=A0A401GIF8_9APHY|nr:hypothetical protein SCP_0402590 [Sparassis crispa]GBE81885.1 hypothetical protein SCP_0402590 [Sparassis crispa]